MYVGFKFIKFICLARIQAAIAAVGATKPGDAGKVVGAVVKAHKGLFDTAVAKRIAEALLAGGAAK